MMTGNLGKVVVLMGGVSMEREVSLSSGEGVLKALRASGVDAEAFDPGKDPWQRLIDGKYDRAFNILHGRGGEDGTIQGLLEWLRLPYTGSGVKASALAIDKQATCDLWTAAGIPVPAGVVVGKDADPAEIIRTLGGSLVIKPNREGSSFGVFKLENATPATLREALDQTLRLDREVVVEKRIHGREFTCAVLGEGEGAHALPIVEIIAPAGDYNSVNKYHGNEVRYVCPAELPEELAKQVSDDAVKAYRKIGARGWGRIDFMLDEDGYYYLLEINTNPGMTPHSLVPMAARAVGISYEELVVRIAREARLD